MLYLVTVLVVRTGIPPQLLCMWPLATFIGKEKKIERKEIPQ